MLEAMERPSFPISAFSLQANSSFTVQPISSSSDHRSQGVCLLQCQFSYTRHSTTRWGSDLQSFQVSDHQNYWKSSGYKNDLNSSGVFKRTMRLGLESMMHNIADSLTNMALRESANQSHGTPHVSEVYVQVNWPWVALPATLIVSACVLLIITAHIARSQDHRLWKTSTLPILYHGLDKDLLKDTEEYSNLSKMEATADSTTVGLGLSDTDGRVLLQR
ncbi:unnamed protein product [Penicillium olsonii]|uniref:Uncharacterized protein n=1 Tax=Penicillium olsonii TaxID=99116 RepID=A0A9W4HCD3_PENOL|nr:unnamed protein product [Penicillium olsonii]CAG7967851.1 unnamed protein product [Penicillium olsonii]